MFIHVKFQKFDDQGTNRIAGGPFGRAAIAQKEMEVGSPWSS